MAIPAVAAGAGGGVAAGAGIGGGAGAAGGFSAGAGVGGSVGIGGATQGGGFNWQNIAGGSRWGMGAISQTYFMHSPRARRTRRKQRTLAKVQAGHRLQRINDMIATHREETIRTHRLMKQEYAGRGLSKSTIATQGLERHERLAARQMAALARAQNEAIRSLEIIRSKNKMEERMDRYNLAAIWLDPMGKFS